MSSIFDPDRDRRRSAHREQIRAAPPPSPPPAVKGTRLSWRLTRTVPRAAVLGLRWGCGLSLLLIAAAAGFATHALDLRLPPERAWLLVALAISAVVFSVAGLWTVILAIRATLSARTPETVIELRELLLRPGSRVRLYVGQRGPVRLNRFAIVLCCRDTEERITEFDVLENDPDTGNDRRRRVREVESFETPIEQTLLEQTDLVIDGRTPFEKTIEIIIPENALPTGTSSLREHFTPDQMGSHVPDDAVHISTVTKTKVDWVIVATGDVAGRADFHHEFPVVVLAPDSSPSDAEQGVASRR